MKQIGITIIIMVCFILSCLMGILNKLAEIKDILTLIQTGG